MTARDYLDRYPYEYYARILVTNTLAAHDPHLWVDTRRVKRPLVIKLADGAITLRPDGTYLITPSAT